MFGNAQARFGLQRHAPGVLEQAAHGAVGHVAVARQLVREGADVARTLHVVLAAQRVHADAFAADVAGRHRQVGDAHHGGRALRMLGHAQAVEDGGVAARRIQARGFAHQLRRHAGDGFHRFRRVVRLRDEIAPLGEGAVLAAFGDEGFGQQAFGDDHVGQRRDSSATLVPGRSCRW
jgi:hypothetical protein